MAKFKLLLTDLDGTLLDTSEYIYAAMEYALAKNNFPIPPRHEIEKRMGPPLEEIYTTFYPDADISQLSHDHLEFQKQHLELAKPFPNTITTLEKLRTAGLKIAAVSTRSGQTVHQTLQANDLEKYFDLIITGSDVQKHKPDPEALNLAMSRLNFQPADAIMVGDTDADVLAARAAKVPVIGCTYGLQGDLVLQHHPDFSIKDIAEILPIILG